MKVKGFAGVAAVTRLDAANYDRAVKGAALGAETLKRVTSVELAPYAVATIQGR